MILSEALSSCFKNDFEYCGQTYESIVWKHISEEVYDELSKKYTKEIEFLEDSE